jgi:mRNA interferase MazF
VEPRDGGAVKPSVVLLNQIRTVDRQRLIRHLGTLRQETMRRVDRALAISVGLLEV